MARGTTIADCICSPASDCRSTQELAAAWSASRRAQARFDQVESGLLRATDRRPARLPASALPSSSLLRLEQTRELKQKGPIDVRLRSSCLASSHEKRATTSGGRARFAPAGVIAASCCLPFFLPTSTCLSPPASSPCLLSSCRRSPPSPSRTRTHTPATVPARPRPTACRSTRARSSPPLTAAARPGRSCARRSSSSSWSGVRTCLLLSDRLRSLG